MESKSKKISTAVSSILILIAFLSVGWLIGWLTGLSNSPVVSAILPLSFSLVGAFSYNLIDRAKRREDTVKSLDQLELNETAKKQIVATLMEKSDSAWSRGFWACTIVFFCIGCFYGIRTGTEIRSPSNSVTSALLQDNGIKINSLTPREYGIICNSHFRLIRLNVPPPEIESFFQSAVKPLFAYDNTHYIKKLSGKINSNQHYRAREIAFGDVLNQIFFNLESSKEKAEPTKVIYKNSGLQGI